MSFQYEQRVFAVSFERKRRGNIPEDLPVVVPSSYTEVIAT